MCDLDELLIRRSKMDSTHFPWIQEKEFAFFPLCFDYGTHSPPFAPSPSWLEQYVILQLSLWALLIRSLSKTQTPETVYFLQVVSQSLAAWNMNWGIQHSPLTVIATLP